MKKKIEIKHVLTGAVLFSYECENNTIKDTLLEAKVTDVNLCWADLRGADLRDILLYEADFRRVDLYGAHLQGANLSYCDLRETNLCFANLTGASLWGADLRRTRFFGAKLREVDVYNSNFFEADLQGISMSDLPKAYVEVCSNQMLHVFTHLREYLPYVREKLLAGEIDGVFIRGKYVDIFGTIAYGFKKDRDNICQSILHYEQGLENPMEQWFYQIRAGSTPNNNVFSAHVLTLIDTVLNKKINTNSIEIL